MPDERMYVLKDEENNYVASKYLLIKKDGKVISTESRKYLINGYSYTIIFDRAQEELAKLNSLNEQYQLHKSFRIESLDRAKKREVLIQESKECPTNFPESRLFFSGARIKTPLKVL